MVLTLNQLAIQENSGKVNKVRVRAIKIPVATEPSIIQTKEQERATCLLGSDFLKISALGN